MNKSEMAAKLAAKCDVPVGKANEIVDCIFSTKSGEGIIATALDAGDKVAVAGFGTFETRRRKAREGRNPATGATIQIAATTAAAFKPAKGLKDRVAR